MVYIGSLSKPLAPGLRLGYIVAAPELINELRHLRRLMLRHPNVFNQRVFAFLLIKVITMACYVVSFSSINIVVSS